MTTDSNPDPLDSFFNVPALVEETPTLPQVTDIQTELDEDFDLARANIQEAVNQAQVAFKDLASISKQMGQPRAYDALSKMLSALVIANKSLVEIHKNKQDVDAPITPTNITHTHQTLIMTTAEMQARLSEVKKQLDEENNGSNR